MSPYIGRFAPSPTGPLHLGSLVCAVASYCDAKKNQGKWLLRIEDIDTARVEKNASNKIVTTLEAYGFVWDDAVIYQSQRIDLYQAALSNLEKNEVIYSCTCSRKEIADSSVLRGIDGLIYPKTCLDKALKKKSPVVKRIKTPNEIIAFKDVIQGDLAQNIGDQIGDFVILRADQIFSYQLAVVVDDAMQEVTHVVRGVDLINSTTRQIFLQKQLSLKTPHYAHIPIICKNNEKLSKQTLAQEISTDDAAKQIHLALCLLNQHPPLSLLNAPIQTLWEWAIFHWDISKIPNTMVINM